LIIPYWSSPVSPQTLFNVSPSTLGDKLFIFNGATDKVANKPSSTVMGKGIGYIIRGPEILRPQTRLHFIKPLLLVFYNGTSLFLYYYR
jgi:hypothetical protein